MPLNHIDQGFPTFSLHCPPKSKIIKPASPHVVYVSLVRCYLEGEGLYVKKNLSFASWVLLKSIQICKNLKIYIFPINPKKLASPLPTPHVPLGGRVPQVGNPWLRWCDSTYGFLKDNFIENYLRCNYQPILPNFQDKIGTKNIRNENNQNSRN